MLKSLRPFLLICTPLVLAACYDTTSEMEVKTDGTVKFRAESILEKSIYNMVTQGAGQDIFKERCEAQGGKFNVDMAHVNCKIEADTTLTDVIAGTVQNKYNSAPLNLAGLAVADNGDGTYAVSYAYDWSIFAGLDTESAAASAEGSADKQAAADDKQAEEETKKGQPDADKQANEAAKEEKKADDKAAKTNDAMSSKINHYLNGYHVKIKLKAPNITDGNGTINNSHDEMDIDVDLGKVNSGEQVLPETFTAVFSTAKK